MNVGELVTTLTLDSTQFDSSLSGSETKLNALGSSMGLLAAGAVAALAAGFVAVGKAAFDFAAEADQANKTIQAQLGITAQEAEKLGDVATEVFKNNFGDSLTDAAEGVTEVQRQLGELVSADELGALTTNAFRLRDAFGLEVGESVNAVKTLMSEFGLTGQQAYDFITKGMQNGLNANGDFLDSVGEYSNLMADNGFAAEEFFSLMETGQLGAALGTDKVADSFKEFGIRIQEMSDEVWGPDGVLQSSLGLSAERVTELFNGMQDGSVTVADMYKEVAPLLGAMENDIHRNTAGVALFGTQWEDMGADAMLALDSTATSLESMAGATEGLDVQYENLGAVFETLNRRAIVAIQPIGDALLQLANEVMPYVILAFDWLETKLPPLMEGFSTAVNNAVQFVKDLFTNTLGQSLTDSESKFTATKDSISGIMNTLREIIGTVLSGIKEFWAENGDEIMETVKLTYDTIMSVIGAVLNIVVPLIEDNFNRVRDFLRTHGDDIKLIIDTAFTNMKTVIDTTLQVIQGIVKTITKLIEGDWKGAWEEIEKITRTIIEGIKSIIDTNLALIKGIWENNQDAIKTKAQEVWDSIKTKIQEVVDGIKTAVTSRMQEVKDGFEGKLGEIITYAEDLPNRFYRAGEALVDNLRSGIMDTFAGLIEDARKKLQELTDLLPGSEPKDASSPLYDLGRRGRALVTNFQEGINAQPITLPFADAIAAEIETLSLSPSAITRNESSTNYSLTLETQQSTGSIATDIRMLSMLSERRF